MIEEGNGGVTEAIFDHSIPPVTSSEALARSS